MEILSLNAVLYSSPFILYSGIIPHKSLWIKGFISFYWIFKPLQKNEYKNVYQLIIKKLINVGKILFIIK